MDWAVAKLRDIDVRAEELLDHDPELVKLYYLNKEWKLSVNAIQRQAIRIIEGGQLALQVQQWIRDYKDLPSKVREYSPIEFLSEGYALNCADAIEDAAARLNLFALEFRKLISEVSPPTVGTAEQLQKVEKAGLKAIQASFQNFPD